MNKKISVIVPIYNVEKYLNRCIESIINQSYSNLEIILIDDGSTDRCPQLCDDWKKKDKRIKVIHKINGGLSDARNSGMDIMTGEYASFIDSDDWINETMFEKLLFLMDRYNGDIVECGFQRTDGKVEIKFNGDINITKIDRYNAMKCVVTEDICPVVWNKLYKADLVRDERFQIGKCNEDEFWTYRIVDKANKIVQTNEQLYYYYFREESIINEKYSIRRLDGLEARYQRMIYLEKYPEIQRLAKKKLLFECIYHYQQGLKVLSDDEFRIFEKKVKSIYHNLHFTKSDIKMFSIKEGIWYALCKLSFDGVCRMRNRLRYGV